MVVTRLQNDFAEVQNGAETEGILKQRIISGGDDRWVLVTILRDVGAFVEVDPEIANVDVVRQFGPVQKIAIEIGVLKVKRIPSTQREVEAVPVGGRPTHTGLDYWSEDEVALGGLREIAAASCDNVVVIFQPQAGAEPPRGWADMQVVVAFGCIGQASVSGGGFAGEGLADGILARGGERRKEKEEGREKTEDRGQRTEKGERRTEKGAQALA
jgi:hypothetical protein